MQNELEDSQRGEGKIRRTGTFKGDWSDTCEFCGNKQLAHRTTYDWIDGELLEHRNPCQQERGSINREWSARARAVRIFELIWWVVIPFLILLVHEIDSVARIAFAVAIFKLAWEIVKIYCRPEKWIPAYGRYRKRNDQELTRKRHFIWHCERNPEGFARLRAENFQRNANSKPEPTNDTSP